ncbi:hypothetical protein KCP71_01965 [Salmonella enterica subsp. enterica]|nr:hypothetical protein KCP71_01965 [Salmonella enterica subsp. enterica]
MLSVLNSGFYMASISTRSTMVGVPSWGINSRIMLTPSIFPQRGFQHSVLLCVASVRTRCGEVKLCEVTVKCRRASTPPSGRLRNVTHHR